MSVSPSPPEPLPVAPRPRLATPAWPALGSFSDEDLPPTPPPLDQAALAGDEGTEIVLDMDDAADAASDSTARARADTPAAGAERPYKRWDPRLRVRLSVNTWQEGDLTANALMTGDISVRGLFVETRQPLPMGTLLNLGLLMVDKGERITLQACVAHIVPPDNRGHRPAGMGLKFVPMPYATRRRWRDFLEWLMDRHSNLERVLVDYSGRRSLTRMRAVAPMAAPPPVAGGMDASLARAPAFDPRKAPAPTPLPQRYKVAMLALMVAVALLAVRAWSGSGGGALEACEAPVVVAGMSCVGPAGAGKYLLGTLDGHSLTRPELTRAQDVAANQSMRLVHEAGGLYRLEPNR